MASAQTQSQQEKARKAAQPQTPQPARRRARPFWTKTRVALGLTVFAVLLVVALATLSSGRRAQPTDPTLATEIPALDGEAFRLADYEGKVVLLNFWATWCGPCRLEIPHLVEINHEYKARGVEVVGLTTEDLSKDPSLRDKVRTFQSQMGIDYRLGFAPRDFALRLMGNKTNIPQVFIFSKDGRQLNRFVGYSDRRPQELRAALEEALKEK
jgi:thiol-disulfide isomerase/thioredoxin